MASILRDASRFAMLLRMRGTAGGRGDGAARAVAPYPRPTNGIFDAITVMNSTLASTRYSSSTAATPPRQTREPSSALESGESL